jgi:1,2-phenylacetyl-CoA epoxidase catalytic subunit
MENVRSSTLPKKYHDAVVRWGQTFLPDYQLLLDNWEKFFPHDRRHELCAFRQMGMCTEIECGELKGKPKFERPSQMTPALADHLLKAIKAQASTELGSIQQHQLTLARAPEEVDQFWVLRMMAEELRHGYQMFSLLLEEDWTSVSDTSGEDMVEEVLQMRTGSHVLGAFNVDFDSFVDNIVFCAFIDRVGKYQLAMQKVSAYQPMAESMPPMLQEEAFHLATGVVPMRRWIQSAAKGEGYVGMDHLQRVVNKWYPRALDMFGDERGGGSNVKMGLKPMNNRDAANQYTEEVRQLLGDLNLRYLRARFPKLSRDEAQSRLKRIVEEGETVEGVTPETMLRLPHPGFFRRRGIHAYQMLDLDGKPIADLEEYKKHLVRVLPEAYTSVRDMTKYLDVMRQVVAGEVKAEDAVHLLPNLSRVGGVCPCSRAVRWVIDEPQKSNGH